MPSPFPGMDPYLESPPFWGELHGSLVLAMMGELKRRVSPTYTVWSDPYIWLHEPVAEMRLVMPDVIAVSGNVIHGDALRATLNAPVNSILPAIRHKGNKYLKIKEVDSDRIITVIEVLSPANKTGEDRKAYLSKRSEYLATGTNLVEIDLLRSGRRMPMGEPSPPSADYYVLVCPAVDFPRTAIWPFTVRDSLPEISVPLLPEDRFVSLPLQTCFDFAYDQGPYDRAVNYQLPPKVALREADAAWARELLKQATN